MQKIKPSKAFEGYGVSNFREHVVPKMMGRYTDGFVLSEHQVCEECNSYFSREIEDKIGLDSYEALLRMRSGTKKMSDGRRIRNNPVFDS